ncbi:hypothetical protein BJ741DRAFT_574706 [Chytriomyces cf. hyalinus JEL632]|nr:hypothetical protein BJ741DRAFT_574706 [Chytriomyces cf. hyalinus JEL632]
MLLLVPAMLAAAFAAATGTQTQKGSCVELRKEATAQVALLCNDVLTSLMDQCTSEPFPDEVKRRHLDNAQPRVQANVLKAVHFNNRLLRAAGETDSTSRTAGGMFGFAAATSSSSRQSSSATSTSSPTSTSTSHTGTATATTSTTVLPGNPADVHCINMTTYVDGAVAACGFSLNSQGPPSTYKQLSCICQNMTLFNTIPSGCDAQNNTKLAEALKQFGTLKPLLFERPDGTCRLCYFILSASPTSAPAPGSAPGSTLDSAPATVYRPAEEAFMAGIGSCQTQTFPSINPGGQNVSAKLLVSERDVLLTCSLEWDLATRDCKRNYATLDRDRGQLSYLVMKMKLQQSPGLGTESMQD